MPPEYLLDPATFTAATDWFDQKVTLPTNLSSAELAMAAPAQVRMQAFFSARIASTNILESLREECAAILAGERTYSEAHARMAEFLAREGYGVPEPKTPADRDVAELASTARLQLIFRQNVAMAQAVGARAVSEHWAVVERYPNYRYVKNTERHARFDGVVLPKDHPFWDTHYPPWEFNCQCFVFDEEGEPNVEGSELRTTPEGAQIGRLVKDGQVLNVMPSESGFVFRSRPSEAFADPDTSLITDPELREMFERELEIKRQQVEIAE
jgi:hypothetical protein